MKPLESLNPYKNNPRINDDSVEYVKNSISEFGFKVPLVIDKNDVIVCGHTRYKASQELGLKEVPCIIADDLTDEQIKMFRLVDNKVKEYSWWDYRKLDEEEARIEMDMSRFGFADDDFDIDGFFEKEYKKKEKAGATEHKAKHKCPCCGKRF